MEANGNGAATPATATRIQIDEPTPPAGIMPVESTIGGVVPPESVIMRLRAMANDVASSGLSIGGCRTAGAAFYKMCLGYEHGIRPMTALSSIDIIEGRGCLQALALAATVEARNLGRIEIESVDDTGCTVRVTKTDRPDWFKLVLYTAKDAAAAGFITLDATGAIVRDPKTGAAVSGKKNWRTNTHDMFVARAIARAYRRWFRVASLGLAYTTEEMEDGSDENGQPLKVELDKGNTAPPWLQPVATEVPAGAAAPVNVIGAPQIAAPVDAIASPASASAVVEPPAPAEPVATAEQIAKAREYCRSLDISKGDWGVIVARFGSDTIKTLSEVRTADLLSYLRNLSNLKMFEAQGILKPDQLTNAIKKRGVTRLIDLPEAGAREMEAKVAEKLTPFDKQKLGLTAAPSNPQSALGNSGPPAGSASPLAAA